MWGLHFLNPHCRATSSGSLIDLYEWIVASWVCLITAAGKSIAKWYLVLRVCTTLFELNAFLSLNPCHSVMSHHITAIVTGMLKEIWGVFSLNTNHHKAYKWKRTSIFFITDTCMVTLYSKVHNYLPKNTIIRNQLKQNSTGFAHQDLLM